MYCPTLCIFPGIEPEATTAPEGGSFDSISALMIELRKKFPNTCILYKEHPNMQSMILDNELSMAGHYRNLQFLDLFRSLCIYPVSGDVFDSFSKFTTVVPVTLTEPQERSLNGLPTIVAGIPYYGLDLPGVVPLSTIEDISSWPMFEKTEISENAYQYLISLINGKTIDNPFGIGSGKMNQASSEFTQEMLNLLQTMTVD